MVFISSTTGSCVYTFATSDTSSILTLYVDDLLLLEGNTPVLKELKRKVMERFTMTQMGDVSLVLGIKISRDREAATLRSVKNTTLSPFVVIWRGYMQPGAHDKGRRGAFSRSAGRYPARSHGNGALTIHYWVPHVSHPMHSLRNHLRRQPIGSNHEQAIQAPCDGSQAPSPIPQGEYVPGDYSPDMLK